MPVGAEELTVLRLLHKAGFQTDGLAVHLAGDFVIAVHQADGSCGCGRLGGRVGAWMHFFRNLDARSWSGGSA